MLVNCFFVFNSAISQNVVKIKHTNFTTSFDTLKKYPIVVEWWSTKKLVGCETPLKRHDSFKADPNLPKNSEINKDFVNSGFDRGHMMPAADNLCQTPQIQQECFYFTNISAQYHRLNAGDWKSLETFVRKETQLKDSVKVWAGNYGVLTKIGTVSVPEFCWKVIYYKKEKKYRGFLFKNDKSQPDGFENNEIDIEKLKKLTNVNLSVE